MAPSQILDWRGRWWWQRKGNPECGVLGSCIVEAPNSKELGITFRDNSYKTLHIVGEDESWLYSHWCTGETELYNTAEDPYELNNLALNATHESAGLMDRLIE
ncbi:hypothetical protein GGS26DRAFT_102156 [Hypomontagnella submonticulosa]|nr:hypothetical protein GGS26DRAFT_102156 [Hypomontagnella submonticulosa]